MMNKPLVCILTAVLLIAGGSASAQRQKNVATRYIYEVYDYDSGIDTSLCYVESDCRVMRIFNQKLEGNIIPGYPEEETLADLTADSVYTALFYADGSAFYSAAAYSNSLLEWDTTKLGKDLWKYTTRVNSNTLEFEVLASDVAGLQANPLSNYGHLNGVLQKYTRNGQVQMRLVGQERIKTAPRVDLERMGKRMTRRELSNLRRERMVLTWNIFDEVQLHWGAQNPHFERSGDGRFAFPEDTVVHFSGGTVALKRVRLPKLPSHYQIFAELHQHSNGDAYDRTGSLFVIPQNCARTFFEGMNSHPDSLPVYFAKNGARYQGMRAENDYLPPVELVRFFTPFGVGHFNDRVQIDGLEWNDETYYKQDITDLAPVLSGDVWIGVFIGNYDGGGHKVSLDLKAYPDSYSWDTLGSRRYCLPLVNTCNVLEMSGQNYGSLFGTDTFSVEFTVPEGVKNLRLRYLSTGHGGWGGGDEFNPKANTISIDGNRTFVHTPWRCDCGTYREWNPVSGNFWNGVSSSDYSRSGWCPGTATQPVWFDLPDLEAGKHVLRISIPQGEPQEGSFSFWNVSACLEGTWE